MEHHLDDLEYEIIPALEEIIITTQLLSLLHNESELLFFTFKVKFTTDYQFTPTIQMTYDKVALRETEKQLKDAKKKFDKLHKQYKKSRSAYQAELIADELTILSEDISDLKMVIRDLREQKKLAETCPTE